MQLREQSKNYTIDENIPLIFFFTRWKKKKNNEERLLYNSTSQRVVRVCNAIVLRHQKSILFQKHPLLYVYKDLWHKNYNPFHA